MKKMRSILCLLMAVLMLFALTACGGGKTDGGKTPSGEDASAKFNPGPKGDEKITLRIGTTGYLGRFLSGHMPMCWWELR